MIEIGKNFLWGIAQAKQQSRQEKSKYKTLGDQARQEAQALQEAYEQQMAYLFRSSAERTKLAYENARKQLAVLRAKRAANGITDQSASAMDEKQLSQLQQVQTQQQTQADLATAAAQQTNIFERKWKELHSAMTRYYKQSHRKSRLGSLGRALVSLLK